MLGRDVRIAILSDVHGNAAALRAVLRAIDRLNPDRVFALGDLVGRGPEPDRVVRMIVRRGIPFIRGNWDDWVVGGEGWDARPKRRAHVEAARKLMRPRSIELLLEGPMSRKLSIGGTTLYLAHGSPRDTMELLGPETSDAQLREAIAPAGDAKVIALGHSHRPFVKTIDGALIINTGTVGYPFDGDPRPSFALLELRDPPRADIVRVPYRLDANLRALKKSGISKELAARYRRALLGEGDQLSDPPAETACGVEAILSALAKPVREAYGQPPSLEALLRLREVVGRVFAALERKRARRLVRRLDEEIALHERINFAEPHNPVRARRLRARAEKRFPRDRRINLGLAWLNLAMRPRDRDSTIAELAARALPYKREVIDAEALLARWKKRGGSPRAT